MDTSNTSQSHVREPNFTPHGIDFDTAHTFARQFASALMQGDRDMAESIVRRAFEKQIVGPRTEEEILALMLTETDLNIRWVTILERVGIVTVRQLLNTTRGQLERVHHFGPAGLMDVESMLYRLGFRTRR